MLIEEHLSIALGSADADTAFKAALELLPGIYKNANGRNVRKLTEKEIEDPVKALDFDFKAMGIVPLFDIQDNNYIGFNNNTQSFAIVNVIDAIETNEGDLKSILALLD